MQCSGVGSSQWLGGVLLNLIPKFNPIWGVDTCQMGDCLLTLWLRTYAAASRMEQNWDTYVSDPKV